MKQAVSIAANGSLFVSTACEIGINYAHVPQHTGVLLKQM